jgi:signal recognition particle receptor subunit beta
LSTVNFNQREVGAKIVYYGPGLSGKTTNLRYIHKALRPSSRGELLALATEGDRTLFFDFLPVTVEKVRDFTLRLSLYTVPGQVFYNATRSLVLQGADGVVFVGDSQPDAFERNKESLENLAENLRDHGVDLAHFPLVIQWNKRDIPNVMELEALRELNPWKAPEFEAAAMLGRGVMDTLKAITRLVVQDLRRKGVVNSDPSPAPAAVEPVGPPRGSPLEEVLGEPQAWEPGSKPLTTTSMQAATPPTTMAPPAQSVRPPTSPSRPRSQPSARPRSAPPVAPPPAPVIVAETEAEEHEGGSFLVALAPPALRGEVASAEVSFASGEYEACLRTALEVIQALGNHPEPVLGAYQLGLDGREIRLLLEATARTVRRHDAALALSVLAQACGRAR